MENDIDPQLLQLFAATNALFTPVRDWSTNSHAAAVWERQEAYLKRGIPCPVGGGSGAERVAASEAATRLERSGVVAYARSKGKRTHWKLSREEYLRIGYWCLLDGLAKTQLAMRAIAANWRRGAVINPDKVSPWAMVSEAVLTGCDLTTDQALRAALVFRLEEMLLPAMVFGWVGSGSDTQGRVAYQLRPEGWKVLDSFPVFEAPKYDSKFANKTADRYSEFFDQERDALRSIKADAKAVVIPLSTIGRPDVEPAPPILDGNARPIGDWEDCSP